MNNQNISPNNKGSEEVDIIALFEYFRKGFWNLINVIGGIFIFIFKLFVRLYLLLKKNWIIVGLIIITSAIIGKFYNLVLPKPYYYEMVVRANYNSVYELYTFTESLQKDIEDVENYSVLSKTLGYDIKTIANINEIGITPVEDFEDVVSSYYGAKGAPFAPSVRDSIFFQTYTIEQYEKEKITPVNYSLHKIYLESKEKLDPVKFEESILTTVNSFTEFTSKKDARMEALDIKEKALRKSLANIDSLLIGLSNTSKSERLSDGVVLRGEAKSNIETDLLQQSREITNELFNIELQKESQEKILVPFSKIRQVEPDGYKINLKTGALFGIVLSILLVLLLEANRALESYAKKHIK